MPKPHRITFKAHFYGESIEDIMVVLYRRCIRYQTKLLLGSLAYWFSKGIAATTITTVLSRISNSKDEKFVNMNNIYDEVRKEHSQIPLEF
jgi:hypothetical protein